MAKAERTIRTPGSSGAAKAAGDGGRGADERAPRPGDGVDGASAASAAPAVNGAGTAGPAGRDHDGSGDEAEDTTDEAEGVTDGEGAPGAAHDAEDPSLAEPVTRTGTGGKAVDGPDDQAEGEGPDTSPEDAEGTPARPKHRRIAVLLAVAAFAYALDVVSKVIVVQKLEHHRPIEVFGEILQFEAVRNPGAAFGFGEALTVVFTLIAVIVIGVIARIARRLYSLPWAIALGLLLGGALGNLTDRIFRSPGVMRGHVVDFIAPTHFAVFNLADSAIVCGGILIVLLSFRGSSPDGTVHRD